MIIVVLTIVKNSTTTLLDVCNHELPLHVDEAHGYERK